MEQMDQSPRLYYQDVQRGVAIAALRAWMKRNLVKLERGYGSGWTEFTYADLTKLAFMREMTNFGMPIEIADAVAHRILREEGLFDEGLPIEAYWRAFAGQVVQVAFTRRTGKWSASKFKKEDQIPFSGSAIFIDAEPLIKEVFEKVLKSAGRRKRKAA
jgi:hypothetical protein